MELTVTDFGVCDDLEEITDSMLCCNGEQLAHLSAIDKETGYKVEASVNAYGEINFIYKDETFWSPSDYTDEIVAMIKDGKFYDNEDVDIFNNNWFEITVDIYNEKGEALTYDGDVYEDYENKADVLKEDMTAWAEYILGNYYEKENIQVITKEDVKNNKGKTDVER